MRNIEEERALLSPLTEDEEVPQPSRVTSRYSKRCRVMAVLFPVAIFAVVLGIALHCNTPSKNTPTASIPAAQVNLKQWFNNRAASLDGTSVNGGFDGKGASYSAESMPTRWLLTGGVNYSLPATWGDVADNIVAEKQTINLNTPLSAHSINILMADDYVDEWADVLVRNLTLSYDDGSSAIVQVLSRPWWSPTWSYSSAIKTSLHYTSKGVSRSIPTGIYEFSTSLPYSSHNPTRRVTSFTLPMTQGTQSRLHIFAVSFLPSSKTGAVSVRSTKVGAALPAADHRDEIRPLEITVASLSDPGSKLHRDIYITATCSGWESTGPANIKRLRGGDEMRVRIDIKKLKSNSPIPKSIRLHVRELGSDDISIDVIAERGETEHDLPEWFDRAKFGIAIQWGPAAIPAFAGENEFAEWYWHSQHNPASATYTHHRATYGENFFYDKFIEQFNGSKFNASRLIDIITSAGGKYFVLTTKHHDGVALFDTKNSSGRNTVSLGPRRDFVAEVMQAAKSRNPDLKRGTYFSLPEWYSPGYKPYAHDEFIGGPVPSAYDSSVLEPYTGYVEVGDFLRDIQLPQMKLLAYEYQTDLLWCDLGGPSLINEWVAEWWEKARHEGRAVGLNNRCGGAADYDTPDYALVSSVRERKWEVNQGIDPTTYGFNKNTPPSAYRSVGELVKTLVDIVAKNGNYLITIGPDEDGAVPPVVVDRLLQLGRWLNDVGDCIYNTSYVFLGTGIDSTARITATPSSFCIILLERPVGNEVSITFPTPIVSGDRISLLGGSGRELPWTSSDKGLVIHLGQDEVGLVDHAWVFQISYVV